MTVMDTTGNVIDTLRTTRGNGSHDAQMWGLAVPRRENKFRIRVEHPDYETGEMVVKLEHPARLNSFRFPDMLLKRKFKTEENLNEVTVRATRLKLRYKGDTIEVDARAFKLSEGSMLESLVRNIPGCELNDNGEIHMNGRKVDYLMLNGKTFFKGNNRIMLDNLPYYTVDKLQFYNQRSERSQLMGKDVERPDYVMDVQLKKEYSIGYLGNVEAGGGTHERWMGRAFALRFTDNSRLSLFGNVNNLNETRRPGGDGKWSQQTSPVGDTKAYNVGGELLIDDKQGRYKEVLNASLMRNNAKEEQRTASQQFRQQEDMFGYSRGKSTKRKTTFNLSNNLTLKRIGLVSDSRFDYSEEENNTLTRSAQLSEQAQVGTEQVIDSIFNTSRSNEIVAIMINKVRDEIQGDGHNWKIQQKFDYHKSLPWGDDLMFTAKGMWNGTEHEKNSHYNLTYAKEGTANDIREQLTQASSRAYDLHFGANYALHFLTGWHVNVGIEHDQRHNNERSDLYRLDWDKNSRPDEILPSQLDYLHLRDTDNSPHNVKTQREEHITASLHRHDYDSQRGRYFSFTTAVDVRYATQWGAYTRGEKTSRPSDSRWLVHPSMDIEFQTRKWHETYQLHYDTDMRPLDLSQAADFIDTSNPLAVEKGNPHLRPSTVHNFSVLFNSRFGKRGQFIMLRSGASVMQNLVAMNSIYDKTTGGYTFVPVNVNGNWNCNNSLDFRMALNESRNLNVESHTSHAYIHSVDMKDDVTSTVKQHIVGQNLKLEYKHSRYTISLLGGVTWNGVQSVGQENLHNTNFNYGGSLQADLPWKLHLSTDIKVYSRRGYADRSLSTNNLLWNAGLDRAFCKGRMVVAAKAFDLLHQISSTHVTINSQGRTETWQLSLPSYLMLSVQFKFNKNPEKT